MKKTLTISSTALGFLALAVGLVFAAGGGIPQASITLQNSDAKYCYTHNNTWTLTKEVTGNTVENGVGTVTWTVTATKDSSGAATFTVHGGLTVTNTGSAPATIGNIVVNLQKPNSPKRGSNAPYVSIAADVADATNGDAATSAKIVAAGSQENPATNAAWLTNNYTVSGAQGTFTETAGSGPLEFTDASDNTVFSLVPQPVIPVGGSVTLLYDATFSTSVLPPAGTPMRVEALVTFGNAGARGGSGSTGTNIDINGNGTLQADEANVRTVPTRVVLAALPAAPDECNDSVTVTDTGATTTGTVTTSNPVGFDAFPAAISSTTSWDVSVDVDSGTDGGNVCNEAQLDGAACGGTLNVIIGYDPITGLPIYATYECAPAADADSSDCAQIGAPTGCTFNDTDYCTYDHGAYAGPGAPGILYNNNFETVFSSGLTIGIADGAGPKHNATWTGNAAGRTSLKSALSGGGSPGALTADTLNASSISGGSLSKATAALTLNIGFNAVGLNGTHTNLGSLTLCNLVEGSMVGSFTLTAAQAALLNGTSINQVLTDANNALGGNGLPAYVGSFGDLNQLVNALNGSFNSCTVSSFATTYLCCQP
jgi:hypothetical protein